MPVTKLPHWEQHYLRYNKRHPATLGLLLWPPSATQNIQIGIATAVRGDSPYGWGISQGPIKYWSGAAKLPDGHQAQRTPIAPLAALYTALRCLQLALPPNTWPQSPVCTGLDILLPNARYITMIQSLSDLTWYSPARRRRDTNVWETLIRPLLLPATCVMRVGTADTTSQQTAYTMAKAGLQTFLETGTADNDSTQVPIPEEQATLLIKNKVVNHSPTASLRIAHRAPAIQKHLCERMQWEVSTFKAVHWDSYYRAFKKRDVNSQIDCSSTFMVGSQWATSANALILTNPTFAQAAVVATRPARTLCGVVNTNVSIFLISKFPKSESILKTKDTRFYHRITYFRSAPKPKLPTTTTKPTHNSLTIPTKGGDRPKQHWLGRPLFRPHLH